jgi:myo-inositol-1-phosphate synthase
MLLHEWDQRGFLGIALWDGGGYKPFAIEVTEALDMDERKLGTDISRAILEPPNGTVGHLGLCEARS